MYGVSSVEREEMTGGEENKEWVEMYGVSGVEKEEKNVLGNVWREEMFGGCR